MRQIYFYGWAPSHFAAMDEYLTSMPTSLENALKLKKDPDAKAEHPWPDWKTYYEDNNNYEEG